MPEISEENLHKLLETAISASLEAGHEILSVYQHPDADFKVEMKSDNSPLTLADRKAHRVIVDRLRQTPFPILSEESRSTEYEERGKWPVFWLVDPLDGTKEFIKRNGEFTVNIALIAHGNPILGVVYIPVKEVLYFGYSPKGAYKIEGINIHNGTDFAKSGNPVQQLPLDSHADKYRVVASRSHMSDETREFIEKLRQEHGETEFISVGSSIKICLVAEGSADIYPRFAPTMEWDTAAGHAIAIAAGKNIYHTDEKTPLTYNKGELLNPWFIVK